MDPIRFHPAAEEEFYKAIQHYNQQQEGLGLQFQQKVDQAVAHIREFPETGFSSAGGTRTLSIHTFPYGVVFKQVNDEFRVYAIRHYHRREDYWHDRLEPDQNND